MNRGHMSGRLVGEIFRCAPADLKPAERLVLLCLAENARDSDRVAKLKSDQIAELCCLGVGTVRNALSELAARCLIVPLHYAQKGRIQNYRLTPLSEHHRASQRHPRVTLNDAQPTLSASLTSDTEPDLSVTTQ